MSLNLHCRVGGREINLCQTPTHISHMCLVQADGTVPWEVAGADAMRAIRVYIEWRKGSLDGVVFEGKEDSDEQHGWLDEEIAKLLDAVIGKEEELEIWMM